MRIHEAQCDGCGAREPLAESPFHMIPRGWLTVSESVERTADEPIGPIGSWQEIATVCSWRCLSTFGLRKAEA